MSAPLNILYLSSWYPVRENPTLGIFVKRHAQAAALLNKVTLLHACADEQMQEGEFRIEKSAINGFRELIVYYGPSRFRIGFIRKIKNLRLKQKYYRFGLGKALEWSGKFDLLHLHIPWPLGELVRRFSRELQIPYIVSEHWTGYQPEDGRYRGSLVRKVTERTTKGAAAVLVVSENLRSAMQLHQIPGNYHIVPNVVDTDLFKPAELLPAENRLIHVSSLDDQQKNVSGLIRAFALAKKSEPSLSLVIIGSGGDETKLKKLSNELGLGGRSVFFKGRKMDEELAIEFQQAKAFVLNSRYENQVVVAIEAMACGIPVIAPSIGSTDPAIGDGRGILFDAGNEEALSDAMLEIIRNHQQYETEYIRRYAVENYAYPVIAHQLDQLYRDTLSK